MRMHVAKSPAHPTRRFVRIWWQMIVEPASIHSKSPLRRLGRAAGFVAPVALLLAVAWAGLSGPKPAPSPGVDASASAEAAVSPSAAPTQPPVPAVAAVFPMNVGSLAVHTPSSAVAERRQPAGVASIVAVAGYLAISDPAARCVEPGSTSGAWCDRVGLLFETPAAGPETGTRGPHLHVTIAAGVQLPPDVTATARAAATGSTPIVVLGDFDTPRCVGEAGSCDRGFVIERLVWANGGAVPLPALVASGVESDATGPPEAADARVIPLLAVLARPATIAQLNPTAGAIAGRVPELRGPLWYVRDVILAQDGYLIPRWVLFDPLTGKLLATAPVTATSFTPSDAPPAALPGG
jgi:hypothetical protein